MIVAAVLAAGTGSRFGPTDKLLATIDGRPMLSHVIQILDEASIDRTVGIVRPEAVDVGELLNSFGVGTIRNPDFDRGPGTTMARAIDVARLYEAEAVLFVLGDMPCVDPATVELLLRRYRSTDAKIVAPDHEGRPGNPVLYDRTHFDALASLADDDDGGSLLDAERVDRVETDDPGVGIDVDTTADLGRAERYLSDGLPSRS